MFEQSIKVSHMSTNENQDSALSVVKRVTRRLRLTLEQPTIAAGWRRISIVALDSDVQLSIFARRLAQALTGIGPVILCNHRLSAPPFDKAMVYRKGETKCVNYEDGEAWLFQQQGHRFLLSEVSASSLEWGRSRLERADLVLLLANSNVEPVAPGTGIETELRLEELALRQVPCELVMLGSGCVPGWTRKWLVGRQVRMYHQINPDSDRDYGRLARSIVGQGVGLVLGGGGARCFAHIGVLRALEEAEIPIDIIGGTSGGALIAAQFAQGKSSEIIRQQMRAYMLDSGKLLDFVLPLVSVIDGKAIIRMLKDIFGDTLIEDLPLPFYCVSADLNRAAPVVHRDGRLMESVRASISIPGIGPPCFDGGRILVDGGVFNILPVDIMRDFRKGPVMTVDVSSKDELLVDETITSELSTWRLWLRRLNPFSSKFAMPNLIEIVSGRN
jgi:NTE family protein